MKRALAAVTALMVALALSGCATQASSQSASSASASSQATSSASQAQSASGSADSSAPASASASASADASQPSSSSAAAWTSAKSIGSASKAAKIDDFDVPKRAVIADIVFAHPVFSYADHAVQAVYEVADVAKLVVRHAEGAHTVPLTDLDVADYGKTWNGTHGGYDVTCYGDVQGNAAICMWKDGNEEYCVTIEGANGSDLRMDDEDVDDIVKAVMVEESPGDDDAKQASSASASSAAGAAKSAEGNMSDDDPDFDVDLVVQENNLGTFVRSYYVKGTDGTDYWAIVTRDADGGEHTTYTNADGKVIKGDFDPDYDGADFDVEAFAENNNLGEFKRYFWVQGEDGMGYWGIVTVGKNNQEYTTYADEQGNMIQGGVEVGSAPDNDKADFDVEALVENNNLGDFEHYYWIQDSGDKGIWAIVTREDDGAERTTYVDEQGNVLQGGR